MEFPSRFCAWPGPGPLLEKLFWVHKAQKNLLASRQISAS
jgi:hypothetical protein